MDLNDQKMNNLPPSPDLDPGTLLNNSLTPAVAHGENKQLRILSLFLSRISLIAQCKI